jgi:hypothetical protein
VLQYHANQIYLSTSMYPHQCRLSPYTAATRRKVSNHGAQILAVVDATTKSQNFDRHHCIFPLFMAGVTSEAVEAKMRAAAFMATLEGTGVGCNASRSRALLLAVCGEQRQYVAAGRPAEHVCWLTYSKTRKMSIINWGL